MDHAYKPDTYKNLLGSIVHAREDAEAALLPSVGGVSVLLVDAIVCLQRAEQIVRALALDEATGSVWAGVAQSRDADT